MIHWCLKSHDVDISRCTVLQSHFSCILTLKSQHRGWASLHSAVHWSTNKGNWVKIWTSDSAKRLILTSSSIQMTNNPQRGHGRSLVTHFTHSTLDIQNLATACPNNSGGHWLHFILLCQVVESSFIDDIPSLTTVCFHFSLWTMIVTLSAVLICGVGVGHVTSCDHAIFWFSWLWVSVDIRGHLPVC